MATDKLAEVTKMHRAGKSLRMQEARGRQEQPGAQGAGREVSYLMNKSALDDEPSQREGRREEAREAARVRAQRRG